MLCISDRVGLGPKKSSASRQSRFTELGFEKLQTAASGVRGFGAGLPARKKLWFKTETPGNVVAAHRPCTPKAALLQVSIACRPRFSMLRRLKSANFCIASCRALDLWLKDVLLFGRAGPRGSVSDLGSSSALDLGLF